MGVLRFRQLAACVVALTLAVSLGTAQDTRIDLVGRRRSPAFNAERLSAYPTDEWITNGGNLANQRYSPLALINRDNVAQWRAVWRASLEGSGVTPRGSDQAEPLHHAGVLYIATSENDVCALDVDSGSILWRYEADIDPTVAQPCCGWAVRGLALGDGKIYMGRLDAQRVSIDECTEQERWSVQVADPNARYSITSAPRYLDGLVITGTSGGVMGTRGRVTACDADTGELVNEGRIFTPYFDEPVLWKPLAAINWPPSSYDPTTHHVHLRIRRLLGRIGRRARIRRPKRRTAHGARRQHRVAAARIRRPVGSVAARATRSPGPIGRIRRPGRHTRQCAAHAAISDRRHRLDGHERPQCNAGVRLGHVAGRHAGRCGISAARPARRVRLRPAFSRPPRASRPCATRCSYAPRQRRHR